MKKSLSQGLLVAAALSLTVTLAQAQMTTTTVTTTPILSSQEVILGPYDVSGVTSAPLPQINVATGNVQLDLLNPSPRDLTFSSPDLHLSVVVPANSEKVIYLGPTDLAGLTPGQTVAYSIIDSNGNQLASSTFINGVMASSVASSSTTVIQEQAQNTTVTPTTSESRSTVRGFW